MRHVIFISILYAILSPWANQNRGSSESIQDWAGNISESYDVNLLEEVFAQVRRISHRIHSATVQAIADVVE